MKKKNGMNTSMIFLPQAISYISDASFLVWVRLSSLLWYLTEWSTGDTCFWWEPWIPHAWNGHALTEGLCRLNVDYNHQHVCTCRFKLLPFYQLPPQIPDSFRSEVKRTHWSYKKKSQPAASDPVRPPTMIMKISHSFPNRSTPSHVILHYTCLEIKSDGGRRERK